MDKSVNKWYKESNFLKTFNEQQYTFFIFLIIYLTEI